MAWRIGIDIGGTFTDVALVEETGGRIAIVKVLTTPRDFGAAVIAGHRPGPCGDNAIDAADVVAAVARHDRGDQRAAGEQGRPRRLRRHARLSRPAGAAPVVARRSLRPVPGRPRGAGAAPLAVRDHRADRRPGRGGDAARRGRDRRRSSRRSAPPTCRRSRCRFLFSFLNDAHERRVGERLRAALPDVAVFLSCDVLPEIREFERASTTAVCAYVGPLLAALSRPAADGAVTALGLPALHVMGSSGGVVDIAEALRMPAMAVESGPAAGVVAARSGRARSSACRT